MANPYFNATYYLANNPDVFAAGINTVEGAWAHYEQYGAAEALTGSVTRSPAPWFDIAYYLAQNPDLATAGLTAAQLFEHFTTYGIAEGRQPSADANVNADSLAAYAAANEDLRDAFGIEEGEELTEEQLEQLAQHYYTYGYQEEREGKPVSYESNPGDTFTITANQDDYLGTDGDDVFNAATDRLDSWKVIDGAAGNDTVNAQYSDGASAALTLLNVENLNVTARGDLDLDLEAAADLENISVTRGSATAAIVLDSIGEDAVVSLNDLEAASVDLNYFGSLEDVDFALNVNNADVDALTVTGDGTTLADAASVTFNVQGDNEVDLAVARAADLEGQTVVVTGAGDLLLGGLSDDSFGTTAADRVKLDATALEGTFGVEVAGGTTYDLRDAAGLGAFIIGTDDATGTVVQRLSSDTIVGVDEADVVSLALDLATGNTAATLALNGDSTVDSLTSSVPARLVELSISVDGETGDTAIIEDIDLAETESLSISVEEDALLEIGVTTFDTGAGLEGLTSLEVAGDGDVTADLTEAVELAVIDLSEHTGVATLNLREDSDTDAEDLLITFGEGDAIIDLSNAAAADLANAYDFVFTGEGIGDIVLNFTNVDVSVAAAEDITFDFSALGIDEDDIDFVDGGTDTVITIGDGSITLTGITGLTLGDFDVVL